MASFNPRALVGTLLLLTVQMILGTVLVDAQNINFSFSHFNISAPDNFLMVSDVQYHAENSSFILNPRSTSQQNSSCGRLLYKDKVKMKDSASGAVASFHTAFTFQITGQDIFHNQDGFIHGDGLSFLFARNSTMLNETSGSFLCLLNELHNGNASNRLFAVEFDTFWNPWVGDPSDSHIGIDINSINSAWSYNLCGDSVWNCSYLCNGGYFTAWIDYDSASHQLEVFFANGSLDNNILKPKNPLIIASLSSLTELLDDYMYVGFSGSTGFYSEVHQIQSWTFTSSGMPDLVSVSKSSHGSGGVANIIAGVSAAAAAVLLGVCFFICCRRRASFVNREKFINLGQNLVPRMFTYKELSKATKNFNNSELLGRGGFGAVYKGSLPSGVLVAVKRMRMESMHGQESFQAEVASLSQIRHRNLVQLRGWCHEGDQLLLVYDYMCHGSLDEWLYHFAKQNLKVSSTLNRYKALPLMLRHSVLSGVAAALLYLHEECTQCVLHRDIKSSNVLLDGDWNAYLGDFGLARVIDHQKQEKTTMMAGTLGYMAPEMAHTGKATKETDIYSFGVLMLEVICRMRPLAACGTEPGDGILVDRVWRAHEAGKILKVADSSLGAFSPVDVKKSGSCGEFESQEASNIILAAGTETLDGEQPAIKATDGATEDKKTITNLLRLGLLCCHPNPEDRPSMRVVFQLLQTSEDMKKYFPPLPAVKPRILYDRHGYPEVVIASSSWSSSSGPNVQDYALESFQSTLLSSGVSSGERDNVHESLCAPDMSVLLAR